LFSTSALVFNNTFMFFYLLKKNKTPPPDRPHGPPICSPPQNIGGPLHIYRWLLYDKKKSSAIQQSKRKIYNPIKIIQIIDTFKRRNLNFHHNNSYV
ncbi:hypothetical protein, partial [Bacillus cereus]|uniref:hypothetical protein n=1 Tax=Bacillus cereus TaxID=1396 RepID=UPI002112F955|nr:hypothetical protein [Bacillus cereus]